MGWGLSEFRHFQDVEAMAGWIEEIIKEMKMEQKEMEKAAKKHG